MTEFIVHDGATVRILIRTMTQAAQARNKTPDRRRSPSDRGGATSEVPSQSLRVNPKCGACIGMAGTLRTQQP